LLISRIIRPDEGLFRLTWIAVQLWVGVLFLTAALPLLPVDQWWIRIGDYPRLQLLIAYLGSAFLLIPFRRRSRAAIAAGALVISAGIQLFWVFSYLPFAPPQVERARVNEPARQLKIMAVNVLEDNQDARPLLDLVKKEGPDLLVLCEVNQRWADDLEPLKDQFHFHRVHPQENGYGLAIYSQLKIPRCDLRAIVDKSIPSYDADVILRCGHTVRVFALHPEPPRPGEDTTKRDGELILVGREVQDNSSAIVLGDLNDVGWSRTSDLFRETSGLLDPRVGRGFYSTFDATSWILRYPLDYVFHSDDFRVVELKVLPSIGSDHYPLWITLSHEPSAEATQEAPELDAGDREDATDAVEAAREVEEVDAAEE